MEQLLKPGASFKQCFTQLVCWPVKWVYYDKIKVLSLYSSRKGIFSNLDICVFAAGQIYCFGSVLAKLFLISPGMIQKRINKVSSKHTFIYQLMWAKLFFYLKVGVWILLLEIFVWLSYIWITMMTYDFCWK